MGCAVYSIHDLYDIDAEKNAIPIGKPIQKIKLYVTDTDMQSVAAGDTGELYIGGPGLAVAYLGQPETTQRVFIKNPIFAAARRFIL